MRTKIFAGALLMAAALSFGSCREHWLDRVAQKALSGIAKELTPAARIPATALRARFSAIGEGLLVYPADVLERGQPAIVWLVKAGKPYALNETARALTPRLPDAREIPKELLTAAEASSQLETMVWVSLSRRSFADEPHEYHLEIPDGA